jgi:enoyl-CoA hydratase
MSDLVLLDRRGPVAVVTLNRPEAMNALSMALRAQLSRALVEVDADLSVHVVILTGAGTRAFTAGLDLKELGSQPGALRGANATSPAENPALAIETCRQPVIGAINGVAITGGLELALACDILIASTNARFADTHSRVGLMPGWGLSQKLSRIIGLSRAKELAFSGNFIDAETAERWGLVNRVVAPDELMHAAIRLAEDIASGDAAFIANYKRLMDDGYGMTFAQGMALEHERSLPYNSSKTPEQLEATRAAVIARGRQQ